eukprot:SAG31_NODE_748_length_12390_cov_6.306484_8_plen_112_part_00
MGWHNSEVPKTPNLNTLASSGIILNQSYVQRWCAPTRASLMSGRYAYNTGMNEYNQHKITTEELSGVPKSFDFIPKVHILFYFILYISCAMPVPELPLSARDLRTALTRRY